MTSALKRNPPPLLTVQAEIVAPSPGPPLPFVRVNSLNHHTGPNDRTLCGTPFLSHLTKRWTNKIGRCSKCEAIHKKRRPLSLRTFGRTHHE